MIKSRRITQLHHQLGYEHTCTLRYNLPSPIGHYIGGLTEDSAPIVGNKMTAYVCNLTLFLFYLEVDDISSK